jgi:G3E family GTPase
MGAIRKTPIVLITGGLGSGKTTLLRRILDSVPFRIAVLMNEFGETAIDSKVVRGRNVDIVELAGGCVCCSMTGEFEAAVKEIVEEFAPDFIAVEATGAAESDALVFEVEDNLPEVRLDCVVCVADAYLGTRHPNVGYTARTQIASADIILINKADLVTQAEAGAVEAEVRQFNERAAILKTVNCAVDVNLLFGRSRLAHSREDDFHAAGTGERYAPPLEKLESFVWTGKKNLRSGKFDELINELPAELIRAKGFVRFEDGGRLFNYVVGRADFEEFSVDETELVFIGRNLDGLRPKIEAGLRACEA